MVELDYIKKVGIACLDKTIQIWDFHNDKLMMKIDQSQGGIHTLVFFEVFQVLLVAGYETNISVIEIDYGNQVFYL